MEEWVEVIRTKLGEMGKLHPNGNLYSKVPPPSQPPKPPSGRNPMSPLPQPPVPASEENNNSASNGSDNMQTTGSSVLPGVIGDNRPGARTSIVDASDESNQTFTTSIYLNQTPPTQPRATSASGSNSAQPQAPNTSSSPQSVSNHCENNNSSPTTR